MSSPNLDSPSVPPQERKIAPLPFRSRNKSSGNHRSLQHLLSSHEIPSCKSSPETCQPLSMDPDIPNCRHSYLHPGNTADASHLSPAAPGVPRMGFQLDQRVSNSPPSERQETVTFRFLHNITPRPSPDPETAPLSSYQDPPDRPNHSSLPILSTPEYSFSQPLHTMYSDEKIAIRGADDPPEQGVPMTPGTSNPSYPRPATSLSPTQASDSSPSPGGLRQRSISDVSVLSQDNDAPSLYDVRDEQAPLELFFTPAFQAALQNGLDIAKRTVTAIEKLMGSSNPTGNLERLFNNAKTLSTFQSSDTRTIAVLGDSGEGKSSLINALIHFPEIAKTGDIGAACTSVVTEYRQKTRDHIAPITIEVEYLSKSEIEELINELLWNYRQLFLPDIEDDKVDPKDYARYQRKSEQAWSALEAGFKHQRAFNKNLLSDMSEGGLERATSTLIQWAHEIEWPNGDNSGTWKSTADTADECCEKTSVFMQDRLWPFTKIIRVYLSAQVLKTGVILADLPGLQDTNLARVRATQKYLTKCDNVFIVSRISRAITDQSLKSSLYSILARHVPVEWEESAGKSLNLAVVCTKSEEINQKTARREFCGPQKEIPLSVIEQLDKDIEDAKNNNNRGLKKQLKRKQEFLLVDARNRHVKKGLQNSYSSKVPGGRLEVFCVSNTTYEKFSRKGNTEMVHASGIPELRRFCHTITAGAQLLEGKHFLQSKLSSLLNSVELWASRSISLQVEESVPDESIHDVFQDVKTEVSNAIDQYTDDFKCTFREVLSEYLGQRNHFWEDAAKFKGQEWHSWHWTQYNAWCLNEGDHQTARRDYVNWNSELIWKMRMELAYQWGLLEDEIPTVFEKLLQSIKTPFLGLTSHFIEQGFAQALVDGVDFRMQDIEYKFSLIQQEFTHEIKLIQRYASEPNDSSYIVSEMIPAYRAAARVSGTGKAAMQRSIVQGRITNGTLFPHISAKIQEDMEQLIQNTFHSLQDVTNAVLDLVDSDIEMALASRPQNMDDAGSQEEEEGRKEELMAEILELKGKHEEILASVAAI